MWYIRPFLDVPTFVYIYILTCSQACPEGGSEYAGPWRSDTVEGAAPGMPSGQKYENPGSRCADPWRSDTPKCATPSKPSDREHRDPALTSGEETYLSTPPPASQIVKAAPAFGDTNSQCYRFKIWRYVSSAQFRPPEG